MSETGSGAGAGKGRPGEPGCPALRAPGQRGASRPARIWGRWAARAPHRPGTRGRPEVGQKRGALSTRARTPQPPPAGYPRKRHTSRSPRLREQGGMGGAEPGAAPRSRPRSPGPRPPLRCQQPPPQSLTRGLRGLGRGGGSGDPRPGHDPRRVSRAVRPPRRTSPSAAAAGSSGAGGARAQALLSPRPAASSCGRRRLCEPEPSRQETRRQRGLNFPSPPPPAPPRPSAAAARHANSLPWVRRAPAPAPQPTNPAPGRLPW